MSVFEGTRPYDRIGTTVLGLELFGWQVLNRMAVPIPAYAKVVWGGHDDY